MTEAINGGLPEKGFRGAIWGCERCAINAIIARRMGVRNKGIRRHFSPSFA